MKLYLVKDHYFALRNTDPVKCDRLQARFTPSNGKCKIQVAFCEKVNAMPDIAWDLLFSIGGFMSEAMGPEATHDLNIRLERVPETTDADPVDLPVNPKISILHYLFENYPQSCKIKVKLANFMNYTMCALLANKLEAENLQVEQKRNRYFCRSRITKVPLSRDPQQLWSRQCSYFGRLTIAIEVPEEESFLEVEKPNPYLAQLNLYKQLLEEGLFKDVVITAANGAEIEAHRGILAVQSPVLRSMFEIGMTESKTGSVDMTDLSEEGVRAYLAFLYYGDLKKAEESCEVAFDLYQAGHKYHLPLLEEKVGRILLEKKDEEFTIGIGLHLFCFARNVFGAMGNELKLKSANVLKAKGNDLASSQEYREFFVEHPEAAMDLNVFQIVSS